MWKLLVVFAVFSNGFMPICGRRKLNFIDLLNFGEQSSDETSISDSSDDDGETRVLRTEDVVDLIKNAKNKKIAYDSKTNKPTHKKHKSRPRKILEGKFTQNDYKRLEDLKQFIRLINPYKKRVGKSLTPNKLLGPIDLGNYERLEQMKDNNKDDVSLYVILDGAAVKQTKHRNQLQNLLTKLLSLSSPTEKPRHGSYKYYYKGFELSPEYLSRRYSREHTEKFPKKQKEDKKRPRREHHASAIGVRTAIPYIRERGDIYESPQFN